MMVTSSLPGTLLHAPLHSISSISKPCFRVEIAWSERWPSLDAPDLGLALALAPRMTLLQVFCFAASCEPKARKPESRIKGSTMTLCTIFSSPEEVGWDGIEALQSPVPER